MVAHVHHADDEVPDGADQSRRRPRQIPIAPITIFAAAARLPPVRLLVNNAARFAWDSFGEFSADEFDRHMAVNARAPALLIDDFAELMPTATRWSSTCWIRSFRPRTPIISATPCPSRLCRALPSLPRARLRPRSIRVNGIAPGLMLRSSGQSEENYRGDARRQPAAARGGARGCDRGASAT